MSALGIAVVRFVTLAAWYVPIEGDDGTTDVLHLIDCRSYEGFSGSPCWVQFAYPGQRAPDQRFPPWISETDVKSRELGSMYHDTILLGMVIEHFKHKVPGELASKVGMALVVPVDCILDTLDHPRFRQQRERTWLSGVKTKAKWSASNSPCRRTRQSSMRSLSSLGS